MVDSTSSGLVASLISSLRENTLGGKTRDEKPDVWRPILLAIVRRPSDERVEK